MTDAEQSKESENAYTRSRKDKAPNHLWKPAFLEAYALTGIIGTACDAAGVSRAGVRDARESDSVFAQDYLDAEQRAIDRLEEEARRRAFEGVEEPVFYKGEICGGKQNYSDDLMKFLLDRKRYPRSLVIDTGDSAREIAADIARTAFAMKGSVPGEGDGGT